MKRSVVAGLLALSIAALGCGEASAPSGAATPSRASAPTASPTPPVITASPAADRPPDAVLSAEGGDPVVGQLGTYTWADGGSDSPWLPGASVSVGAGEPMTVTVGDGAGVGAWSVRRADAASPDGSGAVPDGAGFGPITFAAPEPGAWTIAVTVTFVDGDTATYAWRLDVS